MSAALLVALLLVACEGEAVDAPGPDPAAPSPAAPASQSPSPNPWAGFARGWTPLPEPPVVRGGDAWVWTGTDLLVAGGCDIEVEDRCRRARRAFTFDAGTRTWRDLPRAPLALTGADAVWASGEAIFLLSGGEEGMVGGAAYDPATGTWREIADAPIRRAYGGVRVWTGRELIAWGGGGRGEDRAVEGAAYDPATDSWRPIANAPIGLNLASGVWTGGEVLVFGSLLNGANRAPTPTSVGAAYDPVADAWREIPPSALSPQATSAVWLDDRMVAWDYEVHSQEYDPAGDRWSAPMRMPMAFSECYPDSTVVSGFLFAWFCGVAGLYDEELDGWQRIDGGPLDERIYSEAYRRNIQVWRFADLVAAGSAVVMPMTGITLNRRGVACYGCDGSPSSHWVFRPPDEIVPDRSFEAPGKGRARRVASEFLSAWMLGSDGRLPWLATSGGLERFESRVRDIGLAPDYRIGPVEDLGDGFFEVTAVLFDRDDEVGHLRASLVLGPGRSIGGEPAPLLLVHVRS